jgi:hypothetical protein
MVSLTRLAAGASAVRDYGISSRHRMVPILSGTTDVGPMVDLILGG